MTKERISEETPIVPEKASTHENKMGVQPIGKLLFRMSLPAIFSMTITALYNIVDSIFVAHISEDALSALTLVFPLQMLMVAVSVGTSIGLNSLISRRLGAKLQEQADRAASHGMILALINGLIFALLGIFGSRFYVTAFTDIPSIVTYGTQYCSIVVTFAIFSFVSITIEKIFQATGNMIYPMFIGLAGGLTNLALDPIFIFGLFGFPRLEVVGAAAATVLSQIVSLLLALILLLRKEHLVHISLKNFRFHAQTVKDIYSVGFPAILMQAIGSVMLVGLDAILISFSSTAVAVLGAYFRLQSFVFMPIFGLNQGVMPLTGYNFGAGNKKRVMQTFKLALLSCFTIMTLGLLLFQFFPGALLRLFDASDEMMELGLNALRMISICFLPAAFGISASTLFQATGHGFFSLLISLTRQLIFLLPIAYILAHTLGVFYVWLAFPLSEVSSVAIGLICLIYVYRKEIAHLGE